MSFPRYPEYKDSGVKWLGEVPAHWDVSKMKWIAKMESGHTPDKKVQEYWENGNIPWISLNDTGYLKENNYISDTAYHVTELGLVNSSAHLLPARAVVFSRDATIGRCAITTRPMAVSQHFIAWVCGANMTPEYLLLVLRSMTQELDSLTTGATIKTIGMPEVRALVTPVPPPEEQIAITAFVHRETAKFDALVAEQQRLIELLNEKRQAVISHAVTKGLNPDVPMKPSGVEWLGEVPAHWEVSPLKYFARVGNGSTPSREQPAYWTGGAYPWLNSSAVNQEAITESDQFVTELALSECHLPKILPPAVLIGITGQGRTRGMASTLMIEATISQHIAYIQPNSMKASVGWVRRVIDANYTLLRDESEAGGSTKGAITCEQISALKVPLPPPLEQVAIVAFLDRVLGKIDTLITEAQRAIELLQERRTALISAAVTGQIDVRAIADRAAA